MTDRLLLLSPDSFDLSIAPTAMKVVAKRGLVRLTHTFAMHADQLEAATHSTTLFDFLSLAKINISII